MATQIVKMVIQFRRDTAENWEKYKTQVPAAGEPCFVSDKNILKIGDGVTTFENLEPIGGSGVAVSADGKSIVLENDVFKLMGFDAAEVGAHPRKTADGSIEWVMPVDITSLESDVNSLKTAVSELQEIVTPSGDGATLLSRVEVLEGKMDGTGEGSVDAKIDTKINEFANKISDDGTVNTLKELVNYVAEHGSDVEEIVNDIADLQKLVGTAPVAEQISSELEKNGYIKGVKVNGTLLDAADGIVNIAIAEQALGVKGSDEIDIAEDGTISVKSISWSKITQVEGEDIVFDGGNAAG